MKQLAFGDDKVPFYHHKQENPWGCMYHVLYALTGNTSLLQHVDDLNVEGLHRKALEQGRVPWTLYKAQREVNA